MVLFHVTLPWLKYTLLTFLTNVSQQFDSIWTVFNLFGTMCMGAWDFVEHRAHLTAVVFISLVSMCTEIELKQF